MADKKPTADNWPVVSGDYIVGDPESPVAVTTLASHNEDIPAAAGAAIAGPCKTENLGIEKVVANIISNPNIRFLILCGAEVQGHITGQSIQALHENGCDPEKKKITGATGAIPFVENIPYHSIIGNRKRAGEPGGTDGIVPYTSSHLDGATSELVVKSGHSAQQNPLGIQEVRRILLEHLRSYRDLAPVDQKKILQENTDAEKGKR